MKPLSLFLPCAAGVSAYLADEVQRITQVTPDRLQTQRGGVAVQATWDDALRLNLHTRMAQRVLVLLSQSAYRNEQDLYDAAHAVAWEAWFTPNQSIKVETTAQHSPVRSLNFVALKIKDAVCDRFRAQAGGVRPAVDKHCPDVRIYAHLGPQTCWLYLDSSGEPLFKRGWRVDKGDAPLKETLAAAMLTASGWAQDVQHQPRPLYDPCCGSGTIAIEAAQMACNIAPGMQRRFAFEKYRPFHPPAWAAIKEQARLQERLPALGRTPLIFGSDVAHRMVDFAQRNAQRAGVAELVEFRGGDALQRLPPLDVRLSGGGVLMLNPPYGERVEVAGVASKVGRLGARELAQTQDGAAFFQRLGDHWKQNYAGWSAWVLSPDLKLPGKMRLKESRRVPLWNGPIECRLFGFELGLERP